MKKTIIISILIQIFVIYEASAFLRGLWFQPYVEFSPEEYFSIEVTRDGGYIIGGIAIPDDENQMEDIKLVKTDSEGVIEWSEYYGGDEYETCEKVLLTSEGGFIVVGYTNSFGVGEYDVYVIKIDNQGQIEWSETYGTPFDDRGKDIQMTSDGGYIITGSTQLQDEQQSNLYLVKIDHQGDLLWTRNYGGIDNQFGTSVQETQDNGYIILGYTEDLENRDSDIYAIKTDLNGEIEWERSYGSDDSYDKGISVQVIEDEGYIFAGSAFSDFYMIKTDFHGDEIWSHTYGYDGEDICYNVRKTIDNGYVLIGYTYINRLGNYYIIVVKTDYEGNLEHKDYFTNDIYDQGIDINIEQGIDIEVTEDCGYITLINCYFNEDSYYSGLLRFSAPEERLTLRSNYFELISFYLLPEDFTAGSVFGDVDNLSVVYTNEGDVYLPPDLDFIRELNITQGYRVCCCENSEVVISGVFSDPETEFFVQSFRWNWIGYPFSSRFPIDIAMQEVVDQIEIVLTDDGRLWIPDLDINTIENMIPGEGYAIFATEDLSFRYNREINLAHPKVSDVCIIPEVEGSPKSTGLPYAVLVSFSDELLAEDPSIIEVYDGSMLVGKSMLCENRKVTPVITWQGSSEQGLEGFKPGNDIVIKILNSAGNEIPVESDNSDEQFGKGAFANIQLEYQHSSIPSEFTICSVYPNPFNPSFNLEFTLPSSTNMEFNIYNTNGQEVYHEKKYFQAGSHTHQFNMVRQSMALSSGIYFLQSKFENQVQTRKILMLK